MKMHWIKWYPVQWLHSTARDEMNAAERATFHDFVCLADTSAVPGMFKFVSEESLGRMLNTDPKIVSETIKVCLERKRISVKKDKEGYILKVLKWHIYQALTPVDNNPQKEKDKVNSKDRLSTLILSNLLSSWLLFSKGHGLPEIRSIDDEREKQIRARMKEDKDFNFDKLLDIISRSPFLLGKAGKEPFRASFDWIIKRSNYKKIIEGNYLSKDNFAEMADWAEEKGKKDESI